VNPERHKIIEKITSLLLLAEGTSFPEEADSARMKAAELLVTHKMIPAVVKVEKVVKIERTNWEDWKSWAEERVAESERKVTDIRERCDDLIDEIDEALEEIGICLEFEEDLTPVVTDMRKPKTGLSRFF
jgi:hypothetical protein